MEKKILVKGRLGRFEYPIYTYTDNDRLSILFEFDVERRATYIAKFVCGKAEYTETLTNGQAVILPKDFLERGRFSHVEIYLEARTEYSNKVFISNDPENGGFLIEPLYIEVVDVNSTAKGWLTKIEEYIQLMDKRLSEAEKEIGRYKDEGVPVLAEKDYISEE